MIKDKVTQTLVAQGVPEPKATVMAGSIGRGLGLILLGILLVALGLGAMYLVVVNLKQQPGLGVMALVLGLVFVGVYFIVAGANQMSGQALDAAAESPVFGLVARGIRMWKASK